MVSDVLLGICINCFAGASRNSSSHRGNSPSQSHRRSAWACKSCCLDCSCHIQREVIVKYDSNILKSISTQVFIMHFHLGPYKKALLILHFKLQSWILPASDKVQALTLSLSFGDTASKSQQQCRPTPHLWPKHHIRTVPRPSQIELGYTCSKLPPYPRISSNIYKFTFSTIASWRARRSTQYIQRKSIKIVRLPFKLRFWLSKLCLIPSSIRFAQSKLFFVFGSHAEWVIRKYHMHPCRIWASAA